MDAFAKIAEERIKKAIEEGQFEGLANAGKPLVFEDETWIPEDLRLAYRILKNAGCIPPELELRNEALSLRRLIDTIDDDKERLARLRELEFKILKLNTIRKRAFSLEEFPEYEAKIIDRLKEDGFKFFFGRKFFYLIPPSANNASGLYIPLLLALNSCLTCTNIFSSV